MTVTIIAEAGVNHNGSLDRALDMVDVAAAAGADVIKFQTFSTEALVTREARKAGYQQATTGAGESQFDMLKKLELSLEDHRALVARCAQRGIRFLSTPFDLASLRLLVGLGVRSLKISSGEITNAPLLLAAARSNCQIILSTGMSDLDDVADALGVLAFGYGAAADATPGRAAFSQALTHYHNHLAGNVTLLHCTSAYPTPFDSVNLRAMDTLGQRFGLPVGYSDHTQGLAVSLAAAARGAVVIEKHFTLDRSLPGPDHQASVEPEELGELVRAVRAVTAALGSAEKAPAEIEADTREVARKSLVALRPIRAGEVFTEDALGVKRPGGGISPMDYFDWLGRTATRSFQIDEQIS